MESVPNPKFVWRQSKNQTQEVKCANIHQSANLSFFQSNSMPKLHLIATICHISKFGGDTLNHSRAITITGRYSVWWSLQWTFSFDLWKVTVVKKMAQTLNLSWKQNLCFTINHNKQSKCSSKTPTNQQTRRIIILTLHYITLHNTSWALGRGTDALCA